MPPSAERCCGPPQDWLTSIEIKYYESKVNLNWKNILKSIKEVGRGNVHGPLGTPMRRAET